MAEWSRLWGNEGKGGGGGNSGTPGVLQVLLRRPWSRGGPRAAGRCDLAPGLTVPTGARPVTSSQAHKGDGCAWSPSLTAWLCPFLDQLFVALPGPESRPEVWAAPRADCPGPDPISACPHNPPKPSSHGLQRVQTAAQPRLIRPRAQQDPISHVEAGDFSSSQWCRPSWLQRRQAQGPGFLMTKKCSAPKDMSKWPARKELEINDFSA